MLTSALRCGAARAQAIAPSRDVSAEAERGSRSVEHAGWAQPASRLARHRRVETSTSRPGRWLTFELQLSRARLCGFKASLPSRRTKLEATHFKRTRHAAPVPAHAQVYRNVGADPDLPLASTLDGCCTLLELWEATVQRSPHHLFLGRRLREPGRAPADHYVWETFRCRARESVCRALRHTHEDNALHRGKGVSQLSKQRRVAGRVTWLSGCAANACVA
eukprot:365495-Chlamydomonas_euryale.AAC.8